MRLLLSIILITSSFVNAQQTYVPDDIFEAYLEGNAMGNGIPNDDYVTTANISGVSALIIGGYNIADLTGIEDFTSLTTLYCFDNLLTTLDVSQNTILMDLRCYNNQLTSLIGLQSAILSTLLCDNNDLSSLDVSQATALSDFRCFDNNLPSLDVSQNTALNLLFCYNNPLASLDVSLNTALTDLRCQNTQLTTLNVLQNTGLATLFCYNTQLISLDVSQNNGLNLLFCYNAQLTSLDVSQTATMTDLRCYNNQLTALDVTQSTALTMLICNSNLLTTLDVSQNTALTDLYCQDNLLECLFANNGQNINFDCSNNQLSCISVVFPPWAYTNALYDIGITFEVLCQLALVNDVNQNGNVLTAEQNGATYQWLDCDNNYALIDETGQTYTPYSSGNYAVEITFIDCNGVLFVDTSYCVNVDCESGINNDVDQNGVSLTAEQNGAAYQWLDCDNNYASISGETNQTYNATATGFYAVEIVITDACNVVQIDTSSCHLVYYSGLEELENGTVELIKTVDLLGRETPYRTNTVLIYIYSDGTTERVFKLEE